MPYRETKTVLLIAGMKDNGCREAVAATLELVHGVVEVHVSLYRGSATISHSVQCKTVDLIAVIERAGYGASVPSRAPRLTECQHTTHHQRCENDQDQSP